MSNNEKKSATLGMPYGTATNKLRKIIMFSLLCRLKENVCFKCSLPIDRIEDLSVEHKKPWEGVSSELFWDLQNIAFSHIGCNRPHIYRGGEPLRKIGPEGTAWCLACQKFEPVENFWKDATLWNGLQQRCKKTHHASRQKD